MRCGICCGAFIVLIVLVVYAFSSGGEKEVPVVDNSAQENEVEQEAPEVVKKQEPKYIAEEGAVIVRSHGSRVTYKRKCEKCGVIEKGTRISSVGHRMSTSFKCRVCKSMNKVVIKRVN